jgi:hypothetical protein
MNAPAGNRNWLWFFLTLAALTILATATLAIFNIRQQLQRETVTKAIELWRANGPKDYLLIYTGKKTQDSGDIVDHYVVEVRGGEAREVFVNGTKLDGRQLPFYGMHRLLHDIDHFMETDAEPGKPKTYTRGIFDGRTGALGWYVRRVMGSRQRLEITVELLEAR